MALLGKSIDLWPFRPNQQRPEEARLQVCGCGDNLLPSAGLRDHQRPRQGLPVLPEDRERVPDRE